VREFHENLKRSDLFKSFELDEMSTLKNCVWTYVARDNIMWNEQKNTLLDAKFEQCLVCVLPARLGTS
jgi:hypothetical protein